MNFLESHKFIISLKKRNDRRDELSKQLHLISKHEFIEAVDGSQLPYDARQPLPTGEYHLKQGRYQRERVAMCQAACRMSHQACIQIAKDNGWSEVVIMEDDADLDPLISEKFELWFKEVPSDWEQLYLGAHNFRPLEMVSDHVGKCVTSLSTICYVIKASAYDKVLRALAQPGILDILYIKMHTNNTLNAYCFAPNLVVQKKGKSDIENMIVDYSEYYRK